jgi:hypothetical protein
MTLNDLVNAFKAVGVLMIKIFMTVVTVLYGLLKELLSVLN